MKENPGAASAMEGPTACYRFEAAASHHSLGHPSPASMLSGLCCEYEGRCISQRSGKSIPLLTSIHSGIAMCSEDKERGGGEAGTEEFEGDRADIRLQYAVHANTARLQNAIFHSRWERRT